MNNNLRSFRIFYVLLLVGAVLGCSEADRNRRDSIDYDWVYSQGLKADLNPIIEYLDTLVLDSNDDIEFRRKFMHRFKHQNNTSNLRHSDNREVLEVYHIFEEYWRNGMLDPDTGFDTVLIDELLSFFNSVNDNQLLAKDSVTIKNLDKAFNNFFKSKMLHNVEFGKTGKFYDLLVWKTEKLENEVVELLDTIAIVKTYFLDDFVSLGWQEYARVGNYYPGGWATEGAIFCVAKRYDLRSEKYLINFLKHETQHFSDRINFPNLSAHKFEYRAKLLELHYGDELLFETLASFIRSASNKDSTNAHPYANYNIVKDMSKKVFEQEYVDDINQWKQISKDSINSISKEIYLTDTDLLSKYFKNKH